MTAGTNPGRWRIVYFIGVYRTSPRRVCTRLRYFSFLRTPTIVYSYTLSSPANAIITIYTHVCVCVSSVRPKIYHIVMPRRDDYDKFRFRFGPGSRATHDRRKQISSKPKRAPGPDPLRTSEDRLLCQRPRTTHRLRSYDFIRRPQPASELRP